MTALTFVGLIFDVVGVGILFIYTSTKTIEAEFSYKLVREFTDETVEWLESYSFEEHKERLEFARRGVAKNRRRARGGLVLVMVGFILQAVAVLL